MAELFQKSSDKDLGDDLQARAAREDTLWLLAAAVHKSADYLKPPPTSL